MAYSIKIEPAAFNDIQQAIDYYNEQQAGLGKRFYHTILDSFDTIKLNPFYEIRYDEMRCYYTKPFPFLIHFVVDEQKSSIIVIAVIHTSLNPEKWPYKK